MAREFLNYSLFHMNTFRINVSAEKYIPIYSDDDLLECAAKPAFVKDTKFVLGGGSNVLFTKNIKGSVLHMLTKGISVINETEKNVFVRASAGEDWDAFVQYTLQNGWSGLENLSFIPGTVGASPVQNIGAYGVEAKDVIETVRYFNMKTGTFGTLSNAQCLFGYRDSIFKKKMKNNIIITHVVFRLSKDPLVKTDYGVLLEELKKFPDVTPAVVREAVIAIRKRKLPDPAVLPNAGSFFKNPILSSTQYNKIKRDFPDVPGFETEKRKIKVPAAWLIEQCGWKGFRKNDAGVYAGQPLVLVNYGNASGKEIVTLSNQIIYSVKKKFGIILQTEVNIL